MLAENENTKQKTTTISITDTTLERYKFVKIDLQNIDRKEMNDNELMNKLLDIAERYIEKTRIFLTKRKVN